MLKTFPIPEEEKGITFGQILSVDDESYKEENITKFLVVRKQSLVRAKWRW